MHRNTFLMAALLLSASACGTGAQLRVSDAQEAQAAGMVDVGALIPQARVDMRYYGHDNFVGTRVTGYEAPRCYLHRAAALALRNVQDELSKRNQRLHIFDWYRPARAVAHFMRWANDIADQRTKPAFYPNLEKSTLVKGGYIAERSGHSRGSTMDLTVMQCDAKGAQCRDLDMGTPFDFFDPLANTDDPRISDTVRAHRHQLRDVMQRHGFAPYAMEWWHFTFKPEPTPDTYFDFPVR